MDMILVGDSLAMVALGMEDTSEVLLEEMLLHCRSVARATKAAFTVGDLPMGSYEISPEQALSTAIRFVKEGRVQSVKLEGGNEMAPTIQKITTAATPWFSRLYPKTWQPSSQASSVFPPSASAPVRDAPVKCWSKPTCWATFRPVASCPSL